MMHYAMTYEEAREARGGAWIDPGDFNALPARAALCRTGDAHAKVSRNWEAVDCPACIAKCAVKLVVATGFTHKFSGVTPGFDIIEVQAGWRVHRIGNDPQWWVLPSEVPAWARHDATYRGIPVSPSNIAKV